MLFSLINPEWRNWQTRWTQNQIRYPLQILCHQHNPLKMRVLLFVLVGARWRRFAQKCSRIAA